MEKYLIKTLQILVCLNIFDESLDRPLFMSFVLHSQQNLRAAVLISSFHAVKYHYDQQKYAYLIKDS